VNNGILSIRAAKEWYGGRDYTSARLVTKNKGDWRYGRMSVRARLNQCTARGTWPAIWMLSTDWSYGGWLPDPIEVREEALKAACKWDELKCDLIPGVENGFAARVLHTTVDSFGSLSILRRTSLLRLTINNSE
jgi:hypothetical protein